MGSEEQFYINQCIILLIDIDENCKKGDLAKVVKVNQKEKTVLIQYSTERGYTSQPILIQMDLIKPYNQ
ncbi:hypothetical protein ENUP19_0062G0007 [Entamoeba nuttalli]|uniref:DUF4926 domain-containing protein n=1 Tax=Entamoeba nuttalli TaxID=412467 RepID=A0ABQ0DDR9_9EUKA